MKKNLPILIALGALIVLGLVRYEHFASEYNITSFWRYNSMFALISVGMAFVIITGGIDLSVGTVAAMSSVVAALASPYGGWVAVVLYLMLLGSTLFVRWRSGVWQRIHL